MGLCDTCSQALKNVYLRQVRRSNPGFDVVHAQHDQDTRQSCWICNKYSIWLEDYSPQSLQVWKSGSFQSVFRLDAQITIPNGDSWRIVSLGVTLQPTGFSNEDSELAVTVRLLSCEEYQSNATLEPQITNPDPRVSLVGAWLHQCIHLHARCTLTRKRKDSWYPTRLLLLGPRHGDVRLIISDEHNLQGPYLTLSHRWGNSVYAKLTSKSLESFKKGINVNDLPVNFRETMHIARLAGVKYVWIDSLCIQQDADKKDWELEARLMDKVYSHSFLNVSATLAEDDTRSLFDQSHHPFNPMLLSLPYMRRSRVFKVGSPREKLKMLQRRCRRTWVVDNDVWHDDIEEAPLQSRGWVFQERFLSPRILHFCERQVAWECHEISALEMFPKRVPPGMLWEARSDVVDNLLSARPTTNDSLLDFRRSWDEIIHKYSQTDLTLSKDKLIAFAGVAKAIEDVRNDTYLAGLWKSVFIYRLAWTRTRYDVVESPLEISSGRAPSWSWLSADGEILLPFAEKVRRHFASIVEYPDTISDGSSAITASGSVLLKGSLLPVDSIDWNDDIPSRFRIGGCTLKEGFNFTETHLDLEGTKDQVLQLEKSGIALVPLFATDEHMQCIAVTGMKSPSSMPMVFRRVGACQVAYRKLHIHHQGSQPGWEEDPSTLFFPGEPSYNLLHPIARSVIRSVELDLAENQRLIRLY